MGIAQTFAWTYGVARGDTVEVCGWKAVNPLAHKSGSLNFRSEVGLELLCESWGPHNLILRSK